MRALQRPLAYAFQALSQRPGLGLAAKRRKHVRWHAGQCQQRVVWHGAGWHSARDEAFTEAIAAGKAHFNRCGNCHDYVCASCIDGQNGLCYNCAPNVNVKISQARAQGEVSAASEIANDEGKVRGARRDVTQAMQLVCPQCRAETHGAKFCPECGFKMAQQVSCISCPTMLQPGTKFCTECGTRQS